MYYPMHSLLAANSHAGHPLLARIVCPIAPLQNDVAVDIAAKKAKCHSTSLRERRLNRDWLSSSYVAWDGNVDPIGCLQKTEGGALRPDGLQCGPPEVGA
jgi:hypothetical protein